VYDPATRGGNAPDNRKVRGTIHWLSCAAAVPIEARVYQHLFTQERPLETPPGTSFIDTLNPDSLCVIKNAYGEPCLRDALPPAAAAQAARLQNENNLPSPVYYQFERQGYFVRDTEDGAGGKLVFNKTIGLRDTWAKIQKK
jgi:glutaminyl-tRNA synthetase